MRGEGWGVTCSYAAYRQLYALLQRTGAPALQVCANQVLAAAVSCAAVLSQRLLSAKVAVLAVVVGVVLITTLLCAGDWLTVGHY
jgi:hypothetical protein